MPSESLHTMIETKQPSQQQAASWFAYLTHHTHHTSRLSPSCSLLYHYTALLIPACLLYQTHFPLTLKPLIAYNHSLSPLQCPNPSSTLPYVTIATSLSTLIQPKSPHTPPLQRIIDAMKAHPGNPDVNHEACFAIANFASHNASNKAAIAAAGGIMVC